MATSSPLTVTFRFLRGEFVLVTCVVGNRTKGSFAAGVTVPEYTASGELGSERELLGCRFPSARLCLSYPA